MTRKDLMLPDRDTPRLSLRPREAAEALGISERTLWTWTKRGDVPHVRRNGTVLYPVDLLRRWLNGQAEAQSPTATMSDEPTQKSLDK